MEYLAESTAPVWAIGGLLFTMAAIALAYTRSRGALIAVLAVVLLVAAGLLAERLVVTERESVQMALVDLLAHIEADDLPGVVQRLDPQSNIRADAETLMPKFDIYKARSNGNIDVVFQDPDTATASFGFAANVRHHESGVQGPYFDRVQIDFVRRDGQWVVTGYATDKDWRRDAARL